MTSEAVRHSDALTFQVHQNPLWPVSARWAVFAHGEVEAEGKVYGFGSLAEAFRQARETADRIEQYRAVDYTDPVWIDDEGTTRNFERSTA